MDGGDRWFVRREGVILGPYSAEELRGLVARGKVLASDAISPDGKGSWTQASTVVRAPTMAGVALPSALARVVPSLPPVPSLPFATAPRAWYAARGTQVVGPLDLDAIRDALRGGALHLDDVVCEVGSEVWTRVRETPAFANLLPPLTPGPSPIHVAAPSMSLAVAPPPMPTPSVMAPVAYTPAPAEAAFAPLPPEIAAPTNTTTPPAVSPKFLRALAILGGVSMGSSLLLSVLGAVMGRQPERSAPPSPPESIPIRVAPTAPPAPPIAQVLQTADAAATAPDDFANAPPFWRDPQLQRFTDVCPADLWALFPGPAPGADEFERRANEQRRSALVSALRGPRWVVRLVGDEQVRLGEYDFRRGAFPLHLTEAEVPRCGEGAFSLALATPRVRDVLPEGHRSVRSVGNWCPTWMAEQGVGAAYQWTSPHTVWLPMSEDAARTLAAEESPDLTAYVALQIVGARTDATRAEVYISYVRHNAVCGTHGGAGRVIVGRPVAVRVLLGDRVLLDTAPSPAPPSAGSAASTPGTRSPPRTPRQPRVDEFGIPL